MESYYCPNRFCFHDLVRNEIFPFGDTIGSCSYKDFENNRFLSVLQKLSEGCLWAFPFFVKQYSTFF